MKKNIKTSRSPYFLYTILVTFILGLISIVVIAPQVSNLINLYHRYQEDKILLVKYQKKLSDLKNLKESELIEKNNLLLRAMPSNTDIVYFIASINQIAQESNVIIDEIGMQNIREREATTSAKSVSGAGIAVRVTGDLPMLKSFIGKINSFLPIFSIELINYDASIQSFNLNLSVNSVKFPENIGKIEDPLAIISEEEEALISKFQNYSSLNNSLFEDDLTPGKENPFLQ